MSLVQPGREPIRFMSSADTDIAQDRNLLTVKYTRAQKASPDFATFYDSIEQSIDATISTVIIRTAPEPILALYDFIMTTFVPQASTPAVNPAVAEVSAPGSSDGGLQPSGSAGTIRVMVKLASVQGELRAFCDCSVLMR